MLNLFSFSLNPFPLLAHQQTCSPASQQAQPAPLAGRSRLNRARDPASRPSSRSGPPQPPASAPCAADPWGPVVIPPAASSPRRTQPRVRPRRRNRAVQAGHARHGRFPGLFKPAAAPWIAYPRHRRLLRRLLA
jgi:hypothetical protein